LLAPLAISQPQPPQNGSFRRPAALRIPRGARAASFFRLVLRRPVPRAAGITRRFGRVVGWQPVPPRGPCRAGRGDRAARRAGRGWWAEVRAHMSFARIENTCEPGPPAAASQRTNCFAMIFPSHSAHFQHFLQHFFFFFIHPHSPSLTALPSVPILHPVSVFFASGCLFATTATECLMVLPGVGASFFFIFFIFFLFNFFHHFLYIYFPHTHPTLDHRSFGATPTIARAS
jgi:hypothetical protein